MAGRNVVDILVKSTNRVKPGMDEAKADAEKGGDEAGASFASRFASYVLPGKKSIIATAVSSALALLPALGAVAGVGIAAAIGVKIASKIPAVAAQFKALGTEITGTLEKSVQPLLPFISRIVTQIGTFVKSIGPELGEMFKAVGPLIAPLVHGLMGLVNGVLPGLVAIIRVAEPAIAVFAQVLSSLGSSVGRMFRDMAPAVQASAMVLLAISKVLDGLLPVIAKVAGMMAKTLEPVFVVLAGAIHALMPALLMVGKIFASLASAIMGSLSGALTAIGTLIQGLAPSFGILARTLGQVFQLMENSGVFGVLEDSLESLAGPLARLINALVAGLAPIIPVVIRLITQLSTGAIIVLTRVLLDLIQGLTPLIPFLSRMAPYILAVIAAVKAWAIAQAALDIVLDANPIGLIIIAIAALIVAVVEVVKHWKTIEDVAKTVFGHVKDIIGDVVDWVKGHWPLIVGILLGPIALVVAEIVQHWHAVSSGAQRMVSDVISFFRRMVSDIRGFVSGFGGMLVGAGRALIEGLINGIEAMLGPLESIVAKAANVAKDAWDFITDSHSPSRHMERRGRDFWQGFINGSDSMMGPVRNSASRVAAGALNGAGGAAGRSGGAGGGQLEVTLRAESSDPLMREFLKSLRLEVREVGGGGPDSVQVALGRVA